MKPFVLASILVLPAIASASDGASAVHQKFARDTDEKLLQYVKKNRGLVHEKDNSDCTALHYAARYGRPDTAKWLIEHKADVNTVSYNKFTPMHVVSNAEVAALLIKAGADLNAKDSWGKTPLENAAQNGHKDVCETILSSGYPIDLSTALRLGKRELAVKMIEENPESVKQVEPDMDLFSNTSPLGVAAAQGDKPMVELLLKKGAPLEAATYRPNAGTMTPLSNAVLAGRYEIAELLCAKGADCNVSAGRMYPKLLDYALKHSDRKMVDLLVKHGAKESAQ